MTVLNDNPHHRFRGVLLAMLLAAVILIPRGYLISRAQSERVDDEYHIIRGVHFLFGTLVKSKLALNDPPLGEAITVLPLWLAGCWKKTSLASSALFGQKYSADMILDVIALWKTLLFLPMVGVVFAWVRRVYSSRAAWLATVILLIEPSFAAHIPLPTLDVLGVEGIVIASYLVWRYVDSPTWWRLIRAALSIAVALQLKHTAILLPALALVMVGLAWLRPAPSPPYSGERVGVRGEVTEQHEEAPHPSPLPRVRGRGDQFAQLLAAIVLIPLFMWALNSFECSRPRFPETAEGSPTWQSDHPTAAKLLSRKLPCGLYIASFLQGSWHSGVGHPSFLFGEKGRNGWWYYFPVVSAYKIPIGIGIVMLLAIVSLFKVRPRFDELSVFVPMVAWTALMMTSKIDIGFRHFLPAYAFMLMMSTRVMLLSGVAWSPIAWTSVAIAALHALSFHPEYLTYINFPRHEVWTQISDSNIDWGQGLKLARQWVDAHPDREIFMRDFGWGDPRRIVDVQRRLGKRVHVLDRDAALPRAGVLIISPVPLMGVYERHDPFKPLRSLQPVAVLGNALRVYDLDGARGNKPFKWPAQKPRPTSKPTTSTPAQREAKRAAATRRAATTAATTTTSPAK